MKYCIYCGAKLSDDDVFCIQCGQKVLSLEELKEEALKEEGEKDLEKERL